jgi:hypothetical protein
VRSNDGSRRINRIAALLLGVLVAWQLGAAFAVQIEYYDGYDTVVNAKYFAGIRSVYVYNRSPLMGYMLAPVEALRQKLEFHPLDVRPHHVATGVLHVVYLLGVYALLIRRFGATPASLFAYGATIPTYVFFAYAPFISHDIIPGGMLLWMLYLADRYAEKGGFAHWIQLVVLGAAAPLIKPTYALFWIAVVCAHAYLWLKDKQPRYHANRIGLFAGAVASAGIVWVLSMLVLRHAYPESPMWIAPYLQARFLIDQAPGGMTVPWWLYLRNAPAFGVIPLLLLIPGLAMALKGDRLHAAIATAWIVSLCVMALLSQKEVRYLAFLAPLSAFLIVQPLRWVISGRLRATAAYAVLGVSLLPINPYSPLSEAARVFAPFYRNAEFRNFMEPLEAGPGRPSQILMNGKFGVIAPASSPLIGDPYARIFVLGPHHVALLFGYGSDAVRVVGEKAFRRVEGWPVSTAVIWSAPDPFRKPGPWTSAYTPKADAPVLTLAICEEVRWRAEGSNTLKTGADDVVRLDAVGTATGTQWLLTGEALEREIGALDVELRMDAPGVMDAHRLVMESEQGYRVEGVEDGFELPPGSVIRIRGFDIKRILAPPASDD